MAYWLVKSEEEVYSIDDFKQDKITAWNGVRNYQARNYLRAMQKSDEVLFYHSSCEVIGIAGLSKVKKTAYPDPLQFQTKSEYFDSKATKSKPIWFCPDLEFKCKFPRIISLDTLRKTKELENMQLLKPGSRLSVQSVSEKEFKLILRLVEAKLI